MTARPTNYRTNVGAVLRRDDGKLLLAERINQPGTWQFPQGGVDPGETHEQALWREVYEELGLQEPRSLCDILGFGPPTRYDFPEGSRMSIARRFKGQEQTLFVLSFKGRDADFDLEHFSEPEFQRFDWFSLTEARSLIWQAKRPILEATIQAVPQAFIAA